MSKGAVIAIASGDPGEEYYLMKVTGNGPEVLDKMAEDDWSCSYPAGAEILRGLFYVSVPSKYGRRMYKLNKKKQAMVYAATAHIICPELLAEENHRNTETKPTWLHMIRAMVSHTGTLPTWRAHCSKVLHSNQAHLASYD